MNVGSMGRSTSSDEQPGEAGGVCATGAAFHPSPLSFCLTPHASPLTESANLALILATFVVGLLVDQRFGLVGQLAVSVWTWGVFFCLLHTAPAVGRLIFWVCLAWATAGEIFLSLAWGLYTYRLENIPLFIPPGHVLLLYVGLVLAPRVPQAFVAIVIALAIAYAAFAWFSGFDTVSVLLTGLFLVCMLQAEGRRLYTVMFVAALLMEIYGTWIGNWVWQAEVPYFGFTSANPPLAAGAFYCALDVLVGLTARAIRRRWRPASDGVTAVASPSCRQPA